MSLTGWTSSQQNQVTAFLLEGQTTTYWHLKPLLPVLASQRLTESHSGAFSLKGLLDPLQHIGCSLWGSPGYRLPTDPGREWERVDPMGRRGPYIDTSLQEASLRARGHGLALGPRLLLPVRGIMWLREAHGNCKRHHLHVRGTYGLLEAALACERHPLTSWRPHCSVGAGSL